MKQSDLFTRTLKESPKDETSLNAQLLIRASFIYKEMAGVYVYLPLGLRVLNKINNIIREEMNAIGGQELLLTALQNSELWKKTDRWDDEKVDNWFKTRLKNDTELGLGFTHEEPLTNIMKNYINSYKDLPKYAYQIQVKFRNEMRSKSGIMRCREFLMKDLYSFSKDEKEHNDFYEKSKIAYMKIFDRCGLGDKTFLTFASGGVFSKYSHEFQTLTNSGEDTIYVDKNKKIAINKEVYNDEVLNNLRLNKKDLVEEKAVEVGNIFTLGTRFSDPLGLKFTDENGKQKLVFMGSYGIGPGRVMGTVAEIHNDKDGLIWPKAIAPYYIHILDLRKNMKSDEYLVLQKANFEVLYDNREISAGVKFKDSDLIGIPYQVILSDKLEDKLELKVRGTKELKILTIEELINFLNKPAC
ncbi:MAG: His/Gly/Thr/Pro-type tRNA ligase C-terminal domain-containing protein [Patescibacteria group bacterium]|nr:His/Gly/Thr/Pro-type tRNA ligase C-terminal domain-containing protein [Patescibacteria group bacterium]MDD4304455.1 His/Gly/Thr/Pro-type tRNA ligase C-terminal domain-containing protein [Patescibacteria group bacterium]MDD4695477.1 His/Gly/Thr/Pro-type tRNA ligase C-terminal domain-containing protein [Patescibacteria group bacterium]